MEPRLRALVLNQFVDGFERITGSGVGGFAVRLCRAQVVVMGRFWTAAGEATLESLVKQLSRVS